MIRQMLKLLWRRKRASGFLMAELLLTFFVLWGILAAGLDALNRYLMPNGFSIENVLNINAMEVGVRSTNEERTPLFMRFASELEDMDEIEHVGFSGWSLYQTSMNMGTYDIEDGRKVQMNSAFLSDSCRDILNMDLVRGRWFGIEDDSAQDVPVVINERLARELFGGEDPLGKTFAVTFRVVGVISDFRLYGEFDEPRSLNIQRFVIPPPDDEMISYHLGSILVKLNRPVTAELNARIIETMQAIEPSWSYTITPAEDLHNALIKQRATPYLVAGVAGTALVVMVMLGLFGVLWQNIAGRTREIGLRRAKGANIGHIYAQIVGEMLVITTAGIIPGIVVVLQLIVMDVFGEIPAATHVTAMVLAAVILYGMVVLCSLYPGYMAIRIKPAEALHYE